MSNEEPELLAKKLAGLLSDFTDEEAADFMCLVLALKKKLHEQKQACDD